MSFKYPNTGPIVYHGNGACVLLKIGHHWSPNCLRQLGYVTLPLITVSLVLCLKVKSPLLWRHKGRDGVSNHQPHDCLLNRPFSCRSKKTSKLRVTGFCAGNSPVTGEFPAQKASNAEKVSISWHQHGCNSFEVSVRVFHLCIRSSNDWQKLDYIATVHGKSTQWWRHISDCPDFCERCERDGGSINCFPNSCHENYIFYQETGTCHGESGQIGNLNCIPCNIDELVQERRNSSALAMDLRLSCTNPSTYWSL